MKHLLITFGLLLTAFGNTGSAQLHHETESYYIPTDKQSSDYSSLIKTSEEIYKKSELLLQQAKNLP